MLPSAEFRIGALAVGAALLLLALFTPLLRGASLRSRGRSWLRVAMGVAGAALLCWGLISLVGSRPPAQTAIAARSTPDLSSVDLVDLASVALQSCPRATPPAVPDGASASAEAMAAARSAFQAYDSATNSYLQCVDKTIDGIAQKYAGVALRDDVHALKEFGLSAHNTAIDQERAIADQFNAQIRTYKAKHPQS
jgi:hypothetical protein